MTHFTVISTHTYLGVEPSASGRQGPTRSPVTGASRAPEPLWALAAFADPVVHTSCGTGWPGWTAGVFSERGSHVPVARETSGVSVTLCAAFYTLQGNGRPRVTAAAPCPLYPSRPASRAQSTPRLPPRRRAPPVTCGRTVSVGSAVAGGVGRRATSEPFSLSKLPLLSPSQGFEGAFPLFRLSADLRTGGSGYFFFLNFSL